MVVVRSLIVLFLLMMWCGLLNRFVVLMLVVRMVLLWLMMLGCVVVIIFCDVVWCVLWVLVLIVNIIRCLLIRI